MDASIEHYQNHLESKHQAGTPNSIKIFVGRLFRLGKCISHRRNDRSKEITIISEAKKVL
jgi:hypothetical protein